MSLEVIQHLEHKIEELISFCNRLLEEKRGLENDVEERDREISELRGALDRMNSERQEVSSRIENILNRISILPVNSDSQPVEGEHPSDEHYEHHEDSGGDFHG